MELYVQSRGVSKDYCWLQETKGEITDPPNLNSVIQIVDSEGFSLLVYRVNGQLSLLVTGLKTKNRTDNRTRRIRNSVLWVGKDSDEATLRKLAIQALNGDLAAKVDPAVVSENNAQGFTVNFDLLKPEKLDLQDVKNNPPDDKEHKVGNLSACKNELIGELDKYALPKRDGMLVVVCSTVSKSSLEREQVWRGLSDAISGDDWIDISSADSKKSSKENKGDDFRLDSTTGKSSKNLGKSVSDSQQSSSRSQIKSQSTSSLQNVLQNTSNSNRTLGKYQKWLSLFLAFIVGLLFGIIANQLWYQFTENQLKENIKSLRSERTELKQEKDDLAKNIKIKKEKIKAYAEFEAESETRYTRFQDEVKKSYDSFIYDAEKSKQALQNKLDALQITSDELEAKSS